MKLNYLEQPSFVPLVSTTKTKNSFVLIESIEVTLSDGRELVIPKGYVTKLSSLPKWLLYFFSPNSIKTLAILIHDRLWTEQVSEIEYFGNIYEAFKFSNEEFYKWNLKRKSKIRITNYLLLKFLQYGSFKNYMRKNCSN